MKPANIGMNPSAGADGPCRLEGSSRAGRGLCRPLGRRNSETCMTANQTQEFIAGWKTRADWDAVKAGLKVGDDADGWRKAFQDFFRTRLELRYLTPIKILQDNGTFSGEGFSIAAIQCSLIEFLESTVQGIRYRYERDPSKLGLYEYSSSSKIFGTFLTTRPPFSKEFTKPVAEEFYSGIRCGLLHEARTKGGWRIHAKDSTGRIIDPAQKLLFRDGFQNGLLQFVEAFGAELETNVDYQQAFIRKFDDLCQ